MVGVEAKTPELADVAHIGARSGIEARHLAGQAAVLGVSQERCPPE